MQTRIYLKGDARTLQGFEEKTVTNGVLHSLNGDSLYRENGRWYLVYYEDPFNAIPEYLQDLVEEITMFSTENLLNKRESGIYIHEDATAEVWCTYEKGVWRTEIKIGSATTMEHVNELREKILVGTIRPTRSFEEPQEGPSYDELKVGLQSIMCQVSEMQQKLQLLEKWLVTTKFPLFTRSRLLVWVRAILSTSVVKDIS